jgi:hypothetical protein
MKHFLLFCGLFLAIQSVAQTPATIIVKDEYYNNKKLDKILADLQKKYNFKAGYNKDLLSQLCYISPQPPPPGVSMMSLSLGTASKLVIPVNTTVSPLLRISVCCPHRPASPPAIP